MAITRGFIPESIEDGHVPAFAYLPSGAITPKLGMALTQSSGLLAVATGTTKPSYICMCEKESAVTSGELLPVIRVTDDIVFRTTCSASFADRKLGDRVTLHASNGLQVTATTTNGVATVVGIEGTESGSAVSVRFE